MKNNTRILINNNLHIAEAYEAIVAARQAFDKIESDLRDKKRNKITKAYVDIEEALLKLVENIKWTLLITPHK